MDRDLSRSRAILIGNATYQHPGIPDLHAAGTCVEAIEQLLTGELCGWPAERVTTLVDLAAPHELASRVVDAVQGVEDVLLVYYVGHGLRTGEGQLALALGQTDPHPELRAHTGMLYESLAKILRGCRATTKLVILDCCHAELGNKAHYVFQSADLADAYPVDGLYFIGASAQDKSAKAPLDGPLTYFTDALITVVNEGIPHRPAVLRLDQIFLELRARLLRANLPEPVESGTRGAHQFPFARNAAAAESHLDPEEELALLRRQLAEAQASRRMHKRRLARRAPANETASPPAVLAPPEPASSLSKPSDAAGGAWKARQSPNTPSGDEVDTRAAQAAEPSEATPALGLEHATDLLAPGTMGNVHGIDPVTSQEPSAAAAQATRKRGWTRRRVLISGLAGFGAAGISTGLYLTRTTWPANLIAEMTPTEGSVTSMVFSMDGKTLASCHSINGSVSLWDMDSYQQITALSTDWAYGASLALSPNGKILAGCGYTKEIQLWEMASHQNIATLTRPSPAKIQAVAFSSDGRTLASGDDSGAILLWDVATRQVANIISVGPTSAPATVGSLAFSPDGKKLVSASNDETGEHPHLYVWDAATQSAQTIAELIGHTANITGVTFNVDGTLASCSPLDQTVRLWDLTTEKQTAILQYSAAFRFPNYVAFSPDGKTVAGAGDGSSADNHTGGAVLWDVASHRRIATFTFDAPGDAAVAFSPDKRSLATAANGKIQIWKLP